MKTLFKSALVLSLFVSVLSTVACNKSDTPDATTTGGAGGTTGGTPGSGTTSPTAITATDLSANNYWVSSCTAGTEPITGADHYVYYLSFYNNTFQSGQLWYTGTCSPTNYTVIYYSSGTYTLSSSFITGSTTLQSIQFTIASETVSSQTNAAQSAFNTDCGVSSAYNAGVASGNNGVQFYTHGSPSNTDYFLACQHATFVNNANTVVDNVIGISGTTLSFGAEAIAIPGVYDGATVPSTGSISMTGSSTP